MKRSCQKTWGKALSRMARQNGVGDQTSHWRKRQTARPHSVCTLMAQSPKTSQGGASLSSKRRPPSTKTVQSIRSQPPLSLTMEVEEITHALRWIASKVTVGLHMPSSSQIQWACYKKRNGKPRLECVNGRHSVTFGNSCRYIARDMPEWRETTEQIEWRADQPSRVACFSEDLKCWGAWDWLYLRALKPRTSHHRSPQEERCVESLTGPRRRGHNVSLKAIDHTPPWRHFSAANARCQSVLFWNQWKAAAGPDKRTNCGTDAASASQAGKTIPVNNTAWAFTTDTCTVM